MDTSGRYAAPMTPGAYHVVATSLYDPTAKAVAEIHVILSYAPRISAPL